MLWVIAKRGFDFEGWGAWARVVGEGWYGEGR